jgi:HD-like signal output (HDOD) protein
VAAVLIDGGSKEAMMDAQATHAEAPALDRAALRECVRSTLTRLSRTGELPTLPQAASAALGVARRPDAGVEDLCDVIRTDVGLSARILRVANSAAYARRTPAKTLPEAVLTVGLRKTCDLLVAATARTLFVGPYSESLWRHALASAVASEEVARRTRLVDPQTAFLPGLFHDVGRIAFLLADGAAFEVIHGLAAEGEGDAPELERGWYGFDHAEAGAILAEDWGLAAEQCEAVRWHHRPGCAEAGGALAVLLGCADVVAYEIGCPGSPQRPSQSSLAMLGLDADETTALVTRVREMWQLQNVLLS